MKYEKLLCEKCGQLIGKNNYKRHCKVCDGTYEPVNVNSNLGLYYENEELNIFICNFCKKHFNSKNAAAQHAIRCNANSNRKAYDNLSNYIVNTRKGSNKSNNSDVAKQCSTMKNKYDNGYTSPCKGRKISFDYLYEQHNIAEISKWLEYVNRLNVNIPPYEVTPHNKNCENTYMMLKGGQIINGNTVIMTFEHNFIANILLNGNLCKENTVHHIDKNQANNAINNLLVFETWDDHKRFHNSKYAWLIYDDITHKFKCELYRPH